jgi:hypothetical protein
MRVEDLHHEELLELDPEGGTIRFAGRRALLLDAVAMGLLRQYLVENFGLTAARAVLTQFGFAHGWRMAAALQIGVRGGRAIEDWRRAGPRISTRSRGSSAFSRAARTPLSKRAERCCSRRTRRSSICCTSVAPIRRSVLDHLRPRERLSSASPPVGRSTSSRIAAWARATRRATSWDGPAKNGATSARRSWRSLTRVASRSASTSPSAEVTEDSEGGGGEAPGASSGGGARRCPTWRSRWGSSPRAPKMQRT